MSETLDIPFKSDVVPKTLGPDAEIQFRCHKGISCFNACCKRADITLTPYDIIRLKQRFGITSGEFLKQHTVPFEMDADKVPGVKMRTDDEGACLFVTDEGCSVYEDRPTSCRYYPLGHLALRHKDSSEDEAQYVLIKEQPLQGARGGPDDPDQGLSRGAGHSHVPRDEPRMAAADAQEKVGGPTVGRPSEESLQLYFMACFDVDRFRRFVLSDGFKRAYELDDSTYETLGADDVALMKFGFRFLRQVLFGERTIPERQGVWENRVERRSEVWEARRQAEIARRQQSEDDKYKDGV